MSTYAIALRVRITPEMDAALRAAAAEHGTGSSDLVRQALDEWLAGTIRREIPSVNLAVWHETRLIAAELHALRCAMAAPRPEALDAALTDAIEAAQIAIGWAERTTAGQAAATAYRVAVDRWIVLQTALCGAQAWISLAHPDRVMDVLTRTTEALHALTAALLGKRDRDA